METKTTLSLVIGVTILLIRGYLVQAEYIKIDCSHSKPVEKSGFGECIGGVSTYKDRYGLNTGYTRSCGKLGDDNLGPLQCLIAAENWEKTIKLTVQVIIMLVVLQVMIGHYPEIIRRLVFVGTTMISFNGSVISPYKLTGITLVVSIFGDVVFDSVYGALIGSKSVKPYARGANGRFAK